MAVGLAAERYGSEFMLRPSCLYLLTVKLQRKNEPGSCIAKLKRGGTRIGKNNVFFNPGRIWIDSETVLDFEASLCLSMKHNRRAVLLRLSEGRRTEGIRIAVC